MAEYRVDGLSRGSGFIIQGLGGQAVPRYNLVYLSGVNLWSLADADAAATMPVVGLTVEPLSVNQLGRILLQGVVNNNGWAFTAGGKIYASTVAGALTQTKPVGVDDVPQEIGVAITATEIYFDPKLSGEALSILDYELQTGIIAEPSIASKGNGHTVIVHNETEARDFVWARTDLDTKWSGVELL